MKQRNTATVILMASSIGLLLLLQFLWLRNSYNNSYEDLRKETNGIFRSTIVSMRDSLLQRAFESMPLDSATKKTHPGRSLFRNAFEDGPPDSAVRPGFQNRKYDDDRTDTLRKRQGRRDFRDRRDLVFRLLPDSLKLDSIKANLTTALSRAAIFLPFKVVHVKRGERKASPPGSFVSEVVRFNPVKRYAAIIYSYRPAIFRKIAPQALFSVFLTVLTIAAFYFLYRSILTQQKLVQVKNDFISNITHELKTPIATVSVALEALQNFKGLNDPKLTAEYLGIAQNELGRLSILTDKILKSAVYENKGVSFTMKAVDVSVLVDRVIASMKFVWEKNKTSFLYDKEGDDFTIHGDPDHLVNVIYNLIDNALKYSPAPAIISIRIHALAGEVVFSIGDNGPGIAKEYRKKIFEKFYRVPTGDVHNVKGYGLGLNYVDSVIKGHNGTIQVESNGGQGSKFIVILPRK